MMAARLAMTHARRVLAVATVATVALQPLRRRSTARSFAGGFHAEGAEGGNFEGTRFYPQPDLIDSGVIEAGTIHRVAYSVYGNPDGKAVLFVHGGPGGGTAPENRERAVLRPRDPPPEEAEKDGYVAAYGRRLRGELGDEAMRSAAKAWSVWEGSVSRLRPPSREQIMGKWADDDFSLAFARIENHYFTSGGRVGEPAGFFERDGWLLEPAQTDRIKHIPTVIVQGRYDVVCPATSAYELHKALPDSTLHLTTTGHSSLEPDIIERLVAATDKFRP
ncbi:proline iminopeptidase [Aureococcus anophagefferens]|nr:proline iminopeptidase [Aureococcus anophagefferens]